MQTSAWRTFILFLSSGAGLGYLPLAPGTWGSLLALPLWWAVAQRPLATQVGLCAALTLAAIWVCERAERFYGRHDVQHIVLDEVVGMLTCALGLPFAWPQVGLAFALFRLLDAGKPGPIGYLDRHLGGGMGVVLDDTLAGLCGCALMHVGGHVLGGLA